MASQARIKRTRIPTATARAAASPEPASAAPPERDLDDPKVQQEIREPSASEVTLLGARVPLYPLPAFEARGLTFGLTQSLLLDNQTRLIREDVQESGAITAQRIKGLLAESREYSTKIARYIARAEHPVDAPPDEAFIAARAQQIVDTAAPAEFFAAFDTMLALNKSIEALTARPK